MKTTFQALSLAALLFAFGCGDDAEPDDHASCDHVAEEAEVVCDDQFDDSACATACEAAGHTDDHLNEASECLHDAADCDAALACLADADICPT